ncbi:MAG: right-handed parallel beta-helix repeat-containing protein [Gaiellaceae bacterium]
MKRLLLLAAAGLLAVTVSLSGAGNRPARAIYVSVTGSNEDPGTKARPLRSIEDALRRARPGDTIHVAPGDYRERLVTVHSGAAGAPITLAGSRGARITGDGSGRQIQIRNDYITVRGLTVGDADKLIWIEGAHHVEIVDDRLENGGGECIRIKYFSTHVLIAHDTIDHCGLTGFDLARNEHNGEGVYIGTDPGQLARNPSHSPDASDHNVVTGNTIATYAAECVDIKEAAEHNLVAGNDCSHSRDPNGSGFDARGNDNTFRGNVSAANAGAGIRFGGYHGQGIHETAVGNVAVGNAGFGFLVLRRPQGRICGNVVRQSGRGVVNVAGIDPTARC